METIELFKDLRDACDEIVTAMEADDEQAMYAALGKFTLLMIKFEALK